MKKFFVSSFLVFLFILQPLVVFAENSDLQSIHKAVVDLNVRFQPKMGNNRIDHIKKGQTVKVKKVLQKWCQIEYKKYSSAYVYCPYLKKIIIPQPKITDKPTLTVSKKALSATAIEVRDYNNNLVSIREKALDRVQLLVKGIDTEKDFAEKVLPLFPKIGVIFQDAAEESSLKVPPADTKALFEAAQEIYSIDSQIVERVVTTYKDSSSDKSLEFFNTLSSDLVGKEREAISNYNKIKNQLAEKYGIDIEDMESINS